MRKIVDWKVLKTLVPYSRQHIARLEKAGRFPIRVRLGDHRCGWFEDEIAAWQENLPRHVFTDDDS